MADESGTAVLSATSKPFIPSQVTFTNQQKTNNSDVEHNGSDKVASSSKPQNANKRQGRGRGEKVNLTTRTDNNITNGSNKDGEGSSSQRGQNSKRGSRKVTSNEDRRPKAHDTRQKVEKAGEIGASGIGKADKSRTGRKFKGKLTGDKSDEEKGKDAIVTTGIAQLSIESSDLRSRLILELSTGQYDCAICYSCVTTKSPVWACQQCHTVLHLPCVKKWALSSVEKAELQNSMQDDVSIRSRKGTWRCPGCQLSHTRQQIPDTYKCWDGRVREPHGGKGIPPHSCGKPCAKGKCMHGCAAGICHPGPCPPCPITVTRGCFCGSQQISLRCSQMQTRPTAEPSGVSCGKICGKELVCGHHSCQRTCHEGPCGECEEEVTSKCYCGRNEKQMKCGSGDGRESSTSDGNSWTGRWRCESKCERLFECGKHRCQKSCHVQEKFPSQCPLSPAFIQSCPCGAEDLNVDRLSCEDEVKTCQRTCKKLLLCGHHCSSNCHLGECPPCSAPVVTPCRCGETKKQLTCHERQREEVEGGQEVLCQTVCRSVRLCGKHECRRVCCPLYFQAKNKSKRKPTYEELVEQDPAGYHTCDHTCGKMLTCGLHRCEAACHRGSCQRCLQASFEDLSCHCGRTVMEPPIPCGTQVQCHFPCARPPPACNHPQVVHDCHGDDEPCPPCIFLVDRACMCGKNVVSNVPCHRTRVSCGQTCNAVLSCGFHRCSSFCHEQGDCGSCQQMCGKPRKCGHPCLDSCHAPASCSEVEPCPASVTILCACGNLQQRVRCGSSLHNPVAPDRTLRCTDACLLAQRNAKLAEAFGLSSAQHQARQQLDEYPLNTLNLYGTNANTRRWCEEIENTFTGLIQSNRHAIILQPSNATQRQFMHDLANVFRLQSEDVDEEPRRSVAIRRSINAHVPTPTLSDAFRQHQESLSRLRLTALGPLKRPGSGTSTPNGISTSAVFAEQQMNALLLRDVFGLDDQTLSDALRKIVNAPIHIRWLNEEDVTVLVSNSSTARLHAVRQEIRNAGLLNNGGSRLASEVSVCLCDEKGKIVRIDSGSSGTNGSGNHTQNGSAWSNVLSGANPSNPAPLRPTGTGWAAIAATAPAGQSSRPKASAWGTSMPSSTTRLSVDQSVSLRASTNTNTRERHQQVENSSTPPNIPETWDDTSLI